MRKNDLIKYLQEIKGNPEVQLWNGFVEDFVPLEAPKIATVGKITQYYYLKTVQMEHNICGENTTFDEDYIKELKGIYRDFKYETTDCFSIDDVKQKRYKTKKIIYLSAKITGRKYYDRRGTVSY